MNKTRIVRTLFAQRLHQLNRYATEAERLQRAVLMRLISQAQNTQWGQAHAFPQIQSYEDFASSVPVNTYEELKSYIERMRFGESDVLWKGRIPWFAKSSGTTQDKSKFIPVSREALSDTHYRGGTDAVTWYLRNHPNSRILDGKALILGGSLTPDCNQPQSKVGDLSAILITNINPLVNLMRIPDKATALLADFEEKRERIARAALHQNVTNLSGVPSWMLSVLDRVLELAGKEHLSEVWPHLEVFFHGGVAFTPYRQQYEQMVGNPAMNYMETYNASEGFFGLQDDPSDSAMSLMVDYGIFYEFIPMQEFGKENAPVIPLWEVETGKNYAMVISTSSGLWRYIIGDTVRFTSTNPYKFIITGRTKFFINAFGEELIVDNAERGLQEACRLTGARVSEYTAAPVYMDNHGHCRHQWLIEFSKRPDDPALFASSLDQALQRINSDYEAKRYKDITLQPLEVIVAREGQFNDWLKAKGKLGGQHKVPRLSNQRDTIEEIMSYGQK